MWRPRKFWTNRAIRVLLTLQFLDKMDRCASAKPSSAALSSQNGTTSAGETGNLIKTFGGTKRELGWFSIHLHNSSYLYPQYKSTFDAHCEKTFGICKARTHVGLVRNRSRCSRQQANGTTHRRWHLICVAAVFDFRETDCPGRPVDICDSLAMCLSSPESPFASSRSVATAKQGKVGGKADSKYGPIGSPMSSRLFQWRCSSTWRSPSVHNRRARCGHFDWTFYKVRTSAGVPQGSALDPLLCSLQIIHLSTRNASMYGVVTNGYNPRDEICRGAKSRYTCSFLQY